MTETINELRDNINVIDSQLVDLLNQRFASCIAIGELKKQSGTQILDSKREKEIIQRLSDEAAYPNMVQMIWPVIMNFSRNLQK